MTGTYGKRTDESDKWQSEIGRKKEGWGCVAKGGDGGYRINKYISYVRLKSGSDEWNQQFKLQNHTGNIWHANNSPNKLKSLSH